MNTKDEIGVICQSLRWLELDEPAIIAVHTAIEAAFNAGYLAASRELNELLFWVEPSSSDQPR